MSICYIVGAGDCENLCFKKKSDDLVIAADGGYKYLQSANIESDIVIGDFDSLGEIPESENIIKLNPVKDITDMNAAAQLGREKGYTEFVLYGATGGRIDHTLANVQLIAYLSQTGNKAVIRIGKTVMEALTDGSRKFCSAYKGYISVFAHSDVCEGVSIRGLKYTVENARLKNNFSLGVSNEFIGEESEITVGKGTAILIYSI